MLPEMLAELGKKSFPEMLADVEREMALPEGCRQMQPQELIAAVSDRLPPQERQMAGLFAKLGEAQAILDGMQRA